MLRFHGRCIKFLFANRGDFKRRYLENLPEDLYLDDLVMHKVKCDLAELSARLN